MSQKWNPPDTCPKDGSPFLARITGNGVTPPRVDIVRWVHDHWATEGFSLSIGYLNEKSGRWNIKVLEGWLPCPTP